MIRFAANQPEPQTPADVIDRAMHVRCSHCALPVPRGLVRTGEEHQFCCSACELAYNTIHACDLGRYYDLAAALSRGDKLPASSTGSRYEHFDDPAFHEMYVEQLGPSVRRVELVVDGMHCGACVWLLERLGRVCPGVIESRVVFGRARLIVTWDSNLVGLPKIAHAVDRLGYRLRTAPLRSDERDRDRDRRAIVRLGVAGALTGNVMLAAVALYAGEASGIAASHEALFRWVALVLSLICVAWPGSVFFRGAIASLRVGVPHTDLPVSLGLGAGALAGVWSAITGDDTLYADSLAMLVFLLLAGRWLQSAQQRWSADSIELYHSIAPSVARRVDGEGLREVPAEALESGDIIEVLAGEAFPADGVIVRGETSLDRSTLTGESVPVVADVGVTVEAGVVNLSAPVRLRVTTTGAATRIGRLVDLVRRASDERAPFVQAADRAARVFVLVVLALTAVTAVVWTMIEPSRVVGVCAALLIVTCPCALALSTPLTVSVAIGKALRRGICIKGGETLEAIARAGTVVLDKTGTLTEGECRLVEWIGDEALQLIVSAVEAHSAHPVARALVEQLPRPGSDLHVDDVSSTLGGGVVATVNGDRVAIGSAPFVTAAVDGLRTPGWAAEAIANAATRSLSPVVVAYRDEVRAVAHVGDSIREDARSFVDELRGKGRRVMLLSGDRRDVSLCIARALGISESDVIAEASPERKAEVVGDLESAGGRVVMVGDGVNDAAAMARASAGVAVHGGAEAALNAADVYLARPGLAALAELFGGSARTARLLRLGVVFSISYNALFASIAIAGHMDPLLAAVLMPMSSATVTLLARYGTSFRPPPAGVQT